MNKFKHWLFICFIFLIFFLLTTSLINYFFVIKPIYSSENYKIKDNCDTIIIGASHSAFAFNDQKIKNSLIVAKSGEPIFFTYYKLKNLLEQNDRIKNVILTLAENSIGKYQDHRVTMNYDGSKDLYFTYFQLLDKNGQTYLNPYSGNFIQAYLKYAIGIPLSYNRDFKLFLKFYIGQLDFFDYDFSGGTEGNNTEVHLDDLWIRKKIKLYFYDGNNGNFDVSAIAIQHIYKIAKLCKNKSLRLFIFKTPLHAKFNENIPEYYKTEFKKLIQILASNNAVIYHNYENLDLPDRFYFDGDHLNKLGKDKFTDIIVNDYFEPIHK